MSSREDPFVYVTAANGQVVHIPLSAFLEWEKGGKGEPDPEEYLAEEPQSYGLGNFVYVTGEDGQVIQIPAEKVEEWEAKHKL